MGQLAAAIESTRKELTVSQYTELCGVAYAKPGVTIDQVRAKIIEAAGQEHAEIYFLRNDVLDERDEALLVDFGSIPAEGLGADLIEPVLQAIASLFYNCEIDCVSGMNWGDATIYRMIDGRVETAAAALAPCSEWRPLSEVRNEGDAHAHTDN